MFSQYYVIEAEKQLVLGKAVSVIQDFQEIPCCSLKTGSFLMKSSHVIPVTLPDSEGCKDHQNNMFSNRLTCCFERWYKNICFPTFLFTLMIIHQQSHFLPMLPCFTLVCNIVNNYIRLSPDSEVVLKVIDLFASGFIS